VLVVVPAVVVVVVVVVVIPDGQRSKSPYIFVSSVTYI
jgi:hypothetical protein